MAGTGPPVPDRVPGRPAAPGPKHVLLYLAIAFGIAWTIALVFHLTGAKWQGVAGVVTGVVIMFTPLAGAVIVQKLVRRRPLAELGLGFRLNPWWLAAWLGPVAFALATFGVALLLPGVRYSPGMEGMFERFAGVLPADQLAQMKEQLARMPVSPFLLTLGQVLIAGVTVNAVAGFGEEIGWRGFLYCGLAPLGFWRSSLLTGLIWGAWHAPLILMGHNYPQHPVAGVGMMVAWCVLLGPLFGYIRLKTGSVVGAAVAHGSLNAAAGLAILLLAGGSDLTVGVTGLAGFVVLAAANLALAVFARPRP